MLTIENMSGMAKLTRGGMILIGVVVAVLVYIYYRTSEGFAGSASASQVEPVGLTPVGTFTMYYADWCGHCKVAKPAFEELIKQSPIKVGGRRFNIRMVSPEKEPGAVDSGAKIDGFPTFYYKNEKTGALVQYGGERNVDGYKAFLEQMGKNAA